MEQRDYLVRQVEQFGEVLKKLLSKIQNIRECDHEAILTVNEHFTEDIGIDIATLAALDDEKLIDTLNLNHANMEAMADLLMSIAVHGMTDHKESLLEKSMAMYRRLQQDAYSLDRHFKIEDLESLLS